MVQIDLEYRGDLRCWARHVPSGQTLTTDAPVDNQGKGEFFSPTDLVATALCACIATIMGIIADREGIELEGTRAQVRKFMTEERPRRIARLEVEIHMPSGLDPKQRLLLERCAGACPVRLSLHPEIEISVTYHYPDSTEPTATPPERELTPR